MRILVVSLAIFLSSCSMYNECAERGAQWGYMYGMLSGDHSVVRAQSYSIGGRYMGSGYCE